MKRFRATLDLKPSVLDQLGPQLGAMLRRKPIELEFEAPSIDEARALIAERNAANRGVLAPAIDGSIGTWSVIELVAAPGSSRPERN